MLNNQTLLELIEKYKGERTFFDGELVGAFFTVGHLEKLVEEVVKKYLITEQEPAQEPVSNEAVRAEFRSYVDTNFDVDDGFRFVDFLEGVRYAEKAHGIG